MGISLLSCIVALAATINCNANHCHSADQSFCKGNTLPWLHIYFFLGKSGFIYSYFPFQIRQECVKFRLKNSGSILDMDRDFQFLLSFHVGIENHLGRGAISSGVMSPVCNNDHSTTFTALSRSWRCARLNMETTLPFRYTFSENLRTRTLSTGTSLHLTSFVTLHSESL